LIAFYCTDILKFQTRERWLVNDNFYKMRDEGPLSTIPYPIRVLIGLIVYRKNSQASYAQGVGRYSEEELDLLRREAWAAINEFIIAKLPKTRRKGLDYGEMVPFWAFGGDHPTELDATLFGFLTAVLTCPAYGSLPTFAVSYADSLQES
jgi:hypothetical protein